MIAQFIQFSERRKPGLWDPGFKLNRLDKVKRPVTRLERVMGYMT